MPMPRSLVIVVSMLAAMAVMAPALAGGIPGGGRFVDDDGNTHEANIEAIANDEITLGCRSTVVYCPEENVTRAQMASFLARAFDLPDSATDAFTDDDGNTHEANINRVAAAGISLGCADGPGMYCPDEFVNRAQMGSFLARAMGLDPVTGDRFEDVDGTHEGNINAIAEAGVTLGCTTDGLFYCPTDLVKRSQMASFLARAIPLAPLTVPPRPTEPEGDRLFSFGASDLTCSTDGINCSGTLAMPADSAFHVINGWGGLDDLADLDRYQNDLTFELTIDGAIVPMTIRYQYPDSTVVDPADWDPAVGDLSKQYVFVVPAGMSGVHDFEFRWYDGGVLSLLHDLVVDFG